MSDLVELQENLPKVRIPRSQLVKPLGRMEYIALLCRLAMRVGSDEHSYSVQKLTTTLQQAALTKQACEDMSPEVEASYRKLTERYMALVEAISTQCFARLFAELERIPAEMDEGDFLSRLRILLDV